jgi:hypothetical protein
MWNFVFPDSAYPGDKGEHWDKLGFQGKIQRPIFGSWADGIEESSLHGRVYPGDLAQGLQSKLASRSRKPTTRGLWSQLRCCTKVVQPKQVLLFLFQRKRTKTPKK